MTDEDAPQEPSSAVPGPQTGTELALEWRDLMEMVNGEASRTIYYIIANLFDEVDLTDKEIDVMAKLPAAYKARAAASLIDYAETIREGSRTLDAQIMRLTGELV